MGGTKPCHYLVHWSLVSAKTQPLSSGRALNIDGAREGADEASSGKPGDLIDFKATSVEDFNGVTFVTFDGQTITALPSAGGDLVDFDGDDLAVSCIRVAVSVLFFID